LLAITTLSVATLRMLGVSSLVTWVSLMSMVALVTRVATVSSVVVSHALLCRWCVRTSMVLAVIVVFRRVYTIWRVPILIAGVCHGL